MNQKIGKLTPEQEDQLAVYRDRWTDIGLRTLGERLERHKLTRPELEAMVANVYRAGGLEPPKLVIPVGSLMGCMVAAALIERGASVGDSVRDSVWNSVRDSVWNSVGASVGDSVRDSVEASVRAGVEASVWDSVWNSVEASVRASVRDSVRDSVWDSVLASVRASVWDSVWNSVEASVRAGVRDSVGDSVWNSVRASVGQTKLQWHPPAWGCYDAGWLAWDAYMDEQLGVPGADLAAPMRKIAEHVGYFTPFKDVCIVSAPHVTLHRDDEGQLHSESGPAISYLDGFSVYAIHGHRVPGWIIDEPEKITAEKIKAEENAETRRIMIERFPAGPGAYLTAIQAEVVHTDQVPTDRLDPKSPHLMRALIRTGQGDLFLVGTDGSTQRTYYMPLPSDQVIKTCAQAHEAISPFSIRDNKILSQT